MTSQLGIVYLVGAGPGDPGLITTKGLRLLKEADVIVYDRLVEPILLKEAREDAEIVYAGKEPGPVGTQQEHIYPYLLDRARDGKQVVRLKGGDPFVFGRGGEEAQVLAMAGIPFEIVPGVTSAIAAPAYAGIPVTHRQTSSSFTVVSAEEDPTKSQSAINWEALANVGGTLVILMGWSKLEYIVETLINNGMKPNTTVAVVRWGTRPYQKTITGTLKNIVSKGRAAEFGPPVIVVIGESVKLRNEITWLEEKALFGLRVLVPRSRNQASELSRKLSDEGAEPVEIPTIEIAPPDDYTELDNAIANLGRTNWVIFTSANGVVGFFSRLTRLGLDTRAFNSCKVCAIGSASSSALSRYGIVPDLSPKVYTTDALVELISKTSLARCNIILPTSDIAPDQLSRYLSAHGAKVKKILTYRTLIPQVSKDSALKELAGDRIDVVTFTSSSTVRNLVRLLDGRPTLLKNPLVACIGPETSATAKELGIRVDLIADQHDVAGLVDVLKKNKPTHRGH
ncbi:uroporphyrinogen-III C-methyltransferase [SAR202 cluster bacterium AD-804-J14_MRT_500m]|nr:uroporphyrinogen-III C-methyltransferase [SAR202 cluster bacterium AD-804-J14_MRT_500m]